MFAAEFLKTVTGEPIYDWNCVSSEISERSSIEIKSGQICPDRCSMNLDCQSCLLLPGAEGGWHECRWSIQLGEVCLSSCPHAFIVIHGIGILYMPGAIILLAVIVSILWSHWQKTEQNKTQNAKSRKPKGTHKTSTPPPKQWKTSSR
jgi:hypothetical protein